MLKIVFLSIALLVTLFALGWCKEHQGVKEKEIIERHDNEKECIYNDMNMCWGKCCNDCFEKEACHYTCYEDRHTCGGWK